MGTETELKLSIAPEMVEALLCHPLLATPPRQQHLANTYFDTEDLALTRQQIAVRERQVGGQTLLTVKTAGQSHNGLSQRQEWEGSTQPGQFNFGVLVDQPELATVLTGLARRLVPVFTTDFERLSWQIPLDGSTIEVALDRGTIHVRRGEQYKELPICEVELELKSGHADALGTLAAQLQTTVKLVPTDVSKAARGYALFKALDHSIKKPSGASGTPTA